MYLICDFALIDPAMEANTLLYAWPYCDMKTSVTLGRLVRMLFGAFFLESRELSTVVHWFQRSVDMLVLI